MNQSFKKKVIAASVAATFVAVGAGFVAIPGIAPISAAQANQFADTAQAAAVSAGVSVPKSATAELTGQTFTITENTGGAISSGQIILTPTNGAKFVSATQASTTAGGGTAIALQPNQVDSSGNLILSVSASSTAGPTGTSTIALTSIVMDTSAVTVGNTVSVSISSSSTTTGITSGVSTTLATVQAAGATITADATTVPTYPKLGSTVIANTITVAEVIMGSVKGLTSTTDEIIVTLPTGYTFLTPGTTASTDDFTTDNAAVFSANVAKYDVTGAATTASGKKVIIGNPTVFIPSTATDGNVDATVAVKLSDGTTTKTTTVTLFKVASAASTNVAYTTGTTTAPTTYASLYAGRATQNTGLDVAVKESVGGTLLAGGTVSLTLPTGVTAGKNYAVTTDVSSDGTGVPALTAAVTAADGIDSEDGKNSIMATLAGTDTNVTAGKVTFKLNDIDLADTAVVGDLNVTVGGSSNATAGTVKVATVIRATDSSVSGTTPTVTAGSSLSLPDIVITESKAGALVAGGNLNVYVASANGANLTKTDATVKAFKADGTDISTTIFGAASATLTTTTSGVANFVVTNASTTSTGPVTIKVSGLKATLLSTAVAGDVTAVVGGATDSTTTAVTSDLGAKAFKQTVTVGKVVSAVRPEIPAATATGTNTALTLSGSVVASGNDQGKIGTLYVVAVLPNGQVYSRDAAGAWTLWDGVTAFKAVETGVTLGTHAVNILSVATDVSTIVGTQVYLGYGIGALGTSAYTNLLANATYAKVYTVQ